MRKKVGLGEALLPNTKADIDTIGGHLARYAFAAEFVKGKVVLDVASGCGYGSSYLSDKGAGAVIGGDILAEQIEAARSFYGGLGVEFLALDATRLPFADNSFDAVVSMETIEHLEQYEDYLAECKRVLKKGGLFICSTPLKYHDIPEPAKPNPYHAHEFYLEEFQELLSRFFAEVQLYGQGYWGKVAKTRHRIGLKLERVLERLNFLFYEPYQNINKLLYRRLFHRMRYTRLSQIADFDKMLDEKHKPFPLVGSSLTPICVIAVARK